MTVIKTNPKRRSKNWESVVQNMCGHGWRHLQDADLNAAYGMAIVHAILDGARPSIEDVSTYLKIYPDLLENAFRNLAYNGIFINNKIENDAEALRKGDVYAWGYYGGYAANATRYWWEFPE